MREIKFRGWDTKQQKMYSPEEMGRDELTINPDGRGFVNVNSLDTRLSQYCNHIIPMQFTGLKDKNGKEIYEGDIIQWEDDFGPQEYSDIRKLREVVEFRDGAYQTLATQLGLSDFEVIGNIHENPEILENQ